MRSSHPYTAIFGAAFVAGTVLEAWNLLSFTLILKIFSPLEALQWEASSVLGNAAYSQGTGSAALSVVMHYLVSLVWATIYVFLFAKRRVVDMHPLLNGALFGTVVWFAMTFVVFPLGVGTHIGVNALSYFVGIIANVVCFGIPLAYVVRRLE